MGACGEATPLHPKDERHALRVIRLHFDGFAGDYMESLIYEHFAKETPIK